MEGKGARAVIICVLILGLVVAPIEAKSCCRNTIGRNCFIACRKLTGTSRPVCANLCDCIINPGHHKCPASHPSSNMLENSDDEVIEEVTTNLEASLSGPFWDCPTPEANFCVSLCRMNFPDCVRNCGCIYGPRNGEKSGGT